MKKITLCCCTAIVALASCSKNNDINTVIPITPVTPGISADTLSPGWTKIHAVSTNSGATDIFFTDNSTGYLIESTGVYRSTDGGLTWSLINPSTYVENIAAFGAKAFFSGRTASVNLLTQNAGNSFQNITLGANFADCFFSSANVCYLSGESQIRKSTDGGLTFPVAYNFTNTSNYSSLYFINDLKGWVIRESGLYATTDGGITWSLACSVAGYAGAVDFPDNSTGYFSTNAGIYKTVDGGTTWHNIITLSSAYHDIAFVSPLQGYYNDEHNIYKTTDGGTTWTRVVYLPDNFISEIHFTDANHGWGCCDGGLILKYQ